MNTHGEMLGPNDMDDDEPPNEMNDDMFKRALLKRVYHFRIPFRGRDREMDAHRPENVKKYRYRFSRDQDDDDDDDDDSDDDDDNNSSGPPSALDSRDMDGVNDSRPGGPFGRRPGDHSDEEDEPWRKKKSASLKKKKRFQILEIKKKKSAA